MNKYRLHFFWAIIAAAAVLIAILATAYYLRHQAAAPAETRPTGQPSFTAPANYPLQGVDLSHWDGTVDWPVLKATGISFVYIKATQGSDYPDPQFAQNWRSAAKEGIIRGAYHFYQPGQDPKAQAEFFLKVANPQKGDLVPVLDIEVAEKRSPEQLAADIKLWLETVRARIGRYPIIYTDRAFWEASIQADFSMYPLWIAEWETNRSPLLPGNWTNWVFWQYSSTATVPGVPSKNKVDLDCFQGTSLEDLSRYQLN